MYKRQVVHTTCCLVHFVQSRCLQVTTTTTTNNNNNNSPVHWEERKPLTWDVTAMCPLADSYVATAARVAGSTVEGQLLVSQPNTLTLRLG